MNKKKFRKKEKDLLVLGFIYIVVKLLKNN